LTFKGETGAVDFAQIKQNGADISARGEIDLRDLPGVSLTLLPTAPLLQTAAFEAADCVKAIAFYPAVSTTLPSRPVNELRFSGNLGKAWVVSLLDPNGVDTPQTFPFCSDETPAGKTLTLQIAPSLF
jgi:hypothetical protein